MSEAERIMLEAEAAAARAKADVLERALRGSGASAPMVAPAEPRARSRGPVPVRMPEAPVSDLAAEKAAQALRRKGFRVEG